MKDDLFFYTDLGIFVFCCWESIFYEGDNLVGGFLFFKRSIVGGFLSSGGFVFWLGIIYFLDS
jgi:hypothetical protein